MSAPRTEHGGAERPSNVLPFLQTKRALRHYNTGMSAAGDLSLLLLDREGEAIPAIVTRVAEPNGPEMPPPNAALMLAVLMLEALPAKQRERVRRIVRGMAYSEQPPEAAIQLHNVLRSGALNGRAE